MSLSFLTPWFAQGAQNSTVNEFEAEADNYSRDTMVKVEKVVVVSATCCMILDDYKKLGKKSKKYVGPRLRILCNLQHIFMLLTDQTLSSFFMREDTYNFVEKLVRYCIDGLFKVGELPSDDLKNLGKFKAESFMEYVHGINHVATDYIGALESEFGSKLMTLSSLLMCSPILNKLGLNPALFGYDDMTERALRFDMRKYSGLSYPAIVVEHTTSLLLKLSQAMVAIQKYGPTVGVRSLFVSRDDFIKLDTEYVWLKTNKRNFGCCTEVTNPKNINEKQPFTLMGYYHRCNEALEILDKILPTLKRDPSTKARYEKFKYEILGFQSDAAAELRVNESRPCPYAVMLTGPPGIGKSMIKDIVLTQLHKTDNRNGRFEIEYSPRLVYTYNSNDDFYSGFSTSHTSILLDDVAQKKPDIIKQTAGDDLIDLIKIINTVAFCPNQAELDKKAKTPMRCRYVVGTTNTPDLSVQHVFNCASAIYRRMIFVHCTVKKEYVEQYSVALKGDENNPLNLDLWEFVIEQCRPCGTNNVTHMFWSGTEWTSQRCIVNCEVLCLFLNSDVEKHWKKQDKAVHAYEALVKSDYCVHGISTLVCSKCRSPMVAESATSDNVVRDMVSLILVLPIMALFSIGSLYNYFFPPKHFAKPIWCVRLGRSLINYLPENNMTRRVKWLTYLPERCHPYVCKVAYYYLYDEWFNNATDFYEHYCVETLGMWRYPAFLAAMYGFWQFYRAAKTIFKAESVLSKMPDPDVHEVVRKNYWLKEHAIGEFPAVGSTTSTDDLETALALNNVFMLIHYIDGGCSRTNGFALKSNLIVTVFHAFFEDSIDYIEIFRLNKNGEIGKVTIKVDSTCVHIDQTKDLVFIRVDRVVPFKNLVDYLGSQKEPVYVNAPGKMIYKEKDTGSYHTDEVVFNRIYIGAPRPYMSRRGPFGVKDVYLTSTNTPTETGMCGAPCYVQQVKNRMILGIHCAGDGKGATYIRGIFKEDVFQASEILKVRDVNDNARDIALNFTAEANCIGSVHPKCPTSVLKSGEIVIIGGSKMPRVAPRTHVDVSPCWEEVLNFYRDFGYKNIMHTSPVKCNPKEAILLSMEKAVENAYFKPNDIKFVVDAMSVEFLKNFSKEQLARITPYPWSVAINGRDGIPYLDRLNLKTSGGYGHPGYKKKLFTLVNSTLEHDVNYEMTPQLQTEVDWIMSQYESGLEANPVFKCSFKDEPITFEKAQRNKVRIFSGSPVAFSIVVRRYLLCIIREFVGHRRLLFENAIGANAHGKDWDDIARHVIKHGKDRCFAGDYKNFDKQMSPEIILAAFDVIKNILRAAGWTDDIKYVDGIAIDLAFPTTDLFGTLVQFYGANPSGHPLTTLINSIVNSLYMRLACKSILEKNNYKCIIGGGDCSGCVDFTNFKSVMSLVTYGDDNCGTTSINYPFITHTSIQQALSEVGIIYTSDDKEAESKGLVPLSNITFLKRRFVFSSELQQYVGPLLEDSIFKSLTVWTYSKAITKQEQLAAVIDSANREYFFYGRDIFVNRHNFFLKLLERYNITDWLPEGKLKNYDVLYKSIIDDNRDTSPGGDNGSGTTSHLP